MVPRMMSIMYFLVAVLPLFALYKGGTPPVATWIFGILVGLSIIFTGKVRSSDKSVPSLLWWLGLAFIAASFLSFLSSTTQAWGWDEVVRDAGMILLFFNIARSDPKYHRWFLWGILGTGLLVCLAGLVIFILQPGARFVGSFIDPSSITEKWPNIAASFLLLLWPVAWLTVPHKFLKILITGIILGCLVLTGSRGAWLAFALQLALIGVWMLIKKHSWKPSSAALKAGLGIVVSCIALVTVATGLRSLTFPVSGLGARLTLETADGARSMSERVHYWQQALALTAERPLLGFGPNSFAAAHEKLQTIAAETSSHPHNLLLKLTAERGIPAALFFVLLCILILVIAVRVSVRDPKMLILGIALVGVLIHDVVDTTLLTTGVAISFWMIAGIILASDEKKVSVSHQRILEILLGFFLIVTSVLELQSPVLLRGDIDLQTAADLLQSGDSQDLAEAQRIMETYRLRNPAEARGAYILAKIFVQENQLQKGLKEFKDAYINGAINSPIIIRDTFEAFYAAGDHVFLEENEITGHAMVDSMEDAITLNRHGVIFGSFPEDVRSLLRSLEKIHPDEADHFQEMDADIQADAQKLRQAYQEIPQGKLW